MISKVLQKPISNQDESNQQHSRLLFATGERRPSQRKSCGSVHPVAFATSSRAELLITNRLLPKRHSSPSAAADASQIKISTSNSTLFGLYSNNKEDYDSNKQQQRNSPTSNNRRAGHRNMCKVVPDYPCSNISTLSDCLSLSSLRSGGAHQLWYGGRHLLDGGRQKETFEDLDHVLERYERKKRDSSSMWSNVSNQEESSSIGTYNEEESVMEEQEEEHKKKFVIALCDGDGNFLSVPDAHDSPMHNFSSLEPIKSPRQLSNDEDKSNSSSKEKSAKNKKRPKSCKQRRKISKKSLRRRSSCPISQQNTTDDSDEAGMKNETTRLNSKRSSVSSTPLPAGVVSRYDIQGMQQAADEPLPKWDHSDQHLTTQVQALGFAKGIMSDDSSSSSLEIIVSKRPLPRTLTRPTSSTARLSTATITNNNSQQQQQQRRRPAASVSLYEFQPAIPSNQTEKQQHHHHLLPPTTSICNMIPPPIPPPSSLVVTITGKSNQTPQRSNRNNIQQPQLRIRPLSSTGKRRVPVQIIEDPFKGIEKLPANWTNIEQQRAARGGRLKRNGAGGGRNLQKRPVTAPVNKFPTTSPFASHVSIVKL